jgi:hypothetical protein
MDAEPVGEHRAHLAERSDLMLEDPGDPWKAAGSCPARVIGAPPGGATALRKAGCHFCPRPESARSGVRRERVVVAEQLRGDVGVGCAPDVEQLTHVVGLGCLYCRGSGVDPATLRSPGAGARSLTTRTGLSSVRGVSLHDQGRSAEDTQVLRHDARSSIMRTYAAYGMLYFDAHRPGSS